MRGRNPPATEPGYAPIAAGEVELLVDHPFRERRWVVVKRLPEPGLYFDRDVRELLAERGLSVDHVHRLAMGPRVYYPELKNSARTGTSSDERLVAGGRHSPSERQMGVLVPGGGLQRCDDRLPSLG